MSELNAMKTGTERGREYRKRLKLKNLLSDLQSGKSVISINYAPSTASSTNQFVSDQFRIQEPESSLANNLKLFTITVSKKPPKTAAQRTREYRARLKNKATTHSKKIPKTPAQRVKEYRARQKNNQASKKITAMDVTVEVSNTQDTTTSGKTECLNETQDNATSEKAGCVDKIQDNATSEETDVLKKVHDTYVPFLKKLIWFLVKHKKTSPENISKFKAIYLIFTSASSQEKIETFHANKEKLEHWYKKVYQEKQTDGSKKRKKSNKEQSVETDLTQDANESTQISAKKMCIVSDSASSECSMDVSQNTAASSNPHISSAKNSEKSSETEKELSPKVIQPANPGLKTTPVHTQVQSSSELVTFTCSSCQFKTHDEAEYMKHARENHKTDLSLWCKDCGKCFSNAGVLVTHIKERACIKEEMIYKCGAKDCVFETTVGQTFVHHLRHCHKGSPFIFCVHCQKIFTLPHCLILHMQDDCDFKEKNRKNFSGASTENTVPRNFTPVPRNAVSQPKNIIAQTPAVTYSVNKTVTQSLLMKPLVPVASTSRGRRPTRGRGRGRRRSRFSDSSDSDDPDDPSWLIEDSFGGATPRRSARWAKKLNDVRNPELPTEGETSTSIKKSFNSAELNSKMINCPCCDFMAAFQSVLEDHYIASHKVPNKNACLVCNLKFEDTRSFLNHFEEHRKGILPSQPPSEVEVQQPSLTEVELPSKTKNISVPVSQNPDSINLDNISEIKELFNNVLISIAEANFASYLPKDKAASIPYQVAIHDQDKSGNNSKLKNFEAFKSPEDLIAIKTIQKLKHFFKCGCNNCTFTTDDRKDFILHLKGKHDSESYICCYCLKEESSDFAIAEHIASTHYKLIYQCSKCFYRGCSKAHLQIHIKQDHVLDPSTDILVCEEQNFPNKESEDKESVPDDLNTVWPYVCALGECDFSTYDPKEFKNHSKTSHLTATKYYCHFCKADFLFLQLMNHYKLHGLNLFQCSYCVYGTETKEEILLHLCNMHADQPLKAYMRASREDVLMETKELNMVMHQESAGLNLEDTSSGKKDVVNPPKHAKDIEYTGYENELYHVINNRFYPKHLKAVCFPKYLKNLLSDIICGIPFCNEKFQDIHFYVNHLRTDHDALNIACPHCPEMCDSGVDFRNHLLCHGSKLYACGDKDCEHYDWNKDRVKEHKKAHCDSDLSVLTVREVSSASDEDQLHHLTLKTEFPDIKNAVVCAFCKYRCENQNTMKNHMYREMAYLRFGCSLCGNKYVSRKGIKNHFATSHPDFDILCSIDYNPEVEAVVKLLLKQKFEDEKQVESCVMCSRKFQNLLQLQCHLRICLQKKYRPYKCNHCKYFFINLLALKYHTEKEHNSKLIECTFIPNYAIEDDINKKLLNVRLKYLKDLTKQVEISAEEKGCKIYACSDCEFQAYHKFNAERHSKEKHKDMASITKKFQSSPNHGLNSQQDENSNDSTSNSIAEMYSCGSCVKKMLTIQEVEKHMRKAHSKIIEYLYYYSPDNNKQFSPTDKEKYECAYCKSNQDNLFSLKKHTELMHSDMEFKVKGYLCTQPKSNYFACGYCYLKLDDEAEFQNHLALLHPSLAAKSFGNVQMTKTKRSYSLNSFSNKRVKFDSTVFVCFHCNGAFASLELTTAHSKKSHSRLKLEFKQLDVTSSSTDCKFYKCEFCKFTAERQFLDKHLDLKHKIRLTCSYCGRRFEFASKVKEHHEFYHKNLPIKYSQETVSIKQALCTDVNQTKINNTIEATCDYVTVPKSFLQYGNDAKFADLNSLTMHTETEKNEFIDVPLSYIIKHFNISPKVILKDVMKSNAKYVEKHLSPPREFYDHA